MSHGPAAVERWGIWEGRFAGPVASPAAEGLRFSVDFERDGERMSVPGFSDGDGSCLVRFSPPEAGDWTYRTRSSSDELDGQRGWFTATAPGPGNHGPVGVAGTHHFAHADGTPYRPVGATVYNWMHQSPDLYAATLDAISEAGFTKLRFLVFPQGGGHVEYVPPTFPFPRTDDGGWDVDHPDTGFFRTLDRAVADLLERGIQADVVLFHPYDRGEYGLDGLSAEQDARYLDHVIARLSAYRNVWWSLANEYDLLERPDERWDDVFRQIVRIDPHERLRSIHNWIQLYDYNKPWVTHASIQNGWAVAEPGRAVLYRDAYRKPIVLDEIKYEGDTAERWGNLSGRELVHRFWLATVSGVYATHGESFLTPEGTLHIVVGGEFRGESPARIGFLRRILEEVDGAGLDPIDKWDDTTSTVGIPRRLYIQYLGRHAPASWAFALPQGVLGERVQLGDRYAVDVIDTWHMTVTRHPEVFTIDDVQRNSAAAPGDVPLPEGEAIALRVRLVD